jgi:hypothetical protein
MERGVAVGDWGRFGQKQWVAKGGEQREEEKKKKRKAKIEKRFTPTQSRFSQIHKLPKRTRSKPTQPKRKALRRFRPSLCHQQ